MYMKKEIHIRENAGISRSREYVRVAVPCGRGTFFPKVSFYVVGQDGTFLPSQVRVLKQWPDGSIKWLLTDFAATVPANSSAIYRFACRKEPLSIPSKVLVTPGVDAWRVDTGAGIFTLDARTFRPFLEVRRQGEQFPCSGESVCTFSAEAVTSACFAVEDISLEDSGPLHAVVRCCGRMAAAPVDGPRFRARLHFFAGSMVVKVEFTIHNPRAAKHPGGLWDLGDDGSILFQEMAFTFPFAAQAVQEVLCRPSVDAASVQHAGNGVFCIYQESSGGENWQSPNHRNREGRVPTARRGYVLETDGRETSSGLRASPLVWCGTNGLGVAAALPYFWQEFPKAVEADVRQLTISLFPARFPDLHELQGGERKTHTFYLDFAAAVDGLMWAVFPLQAVASSDDYRASGIFPDLPDEEDLLDHFCTADEILQKREAVDEYGWRNFGEVYADHEAVYHPGDGRFVSHYNNQYDFCAGAYRKYFATGDPSWGRLAGELARHVLDIDIYHTNRDREEYNGGLFWHTDHYLDAGLSSHRSFSREQVAGKDARFCGGGPGPEHCYTTGLLFHYFQTGNPDFREAVIGMAEWGLRALDGPQTMLEALKRSVGYLDRWRAFRGSRRLFPRYPLTRGTGNAVTACLDAFEGGGGRRFLEKAEKLIRGALHPRDDIAARDLLDAEVAWSYTVLLAAVGKFLDKKCELGERDGGFAHARASLLAYGEWMVANEYPYLEKPEILEYPNETWAAQDLRKSVIFHHAARYSSPQRREAFLEKGRFFFERACTELRSHETSSLARPLVLMLQNGWVGGRLCTEPTQASETVSAEQKISGRPTPYLTLGSVCSRIGADIVQALKRSSFKREVAWLRARMTM
jgi:hypothetical protein